MRGYRLPRHVRSLHDVDDIVMRVVEQVDPKLTTTFVYEREGSLWQYMRTVARNLVISLGRSREPVQEELPHDLEARGWLPDMDAVRSDQREAFEGALASLNPRQRDAVVMRLEYGFSYKEIADEVDMPTENAARMMVERAIVKMMEHIRQHRDFGD